MSLLPDLTPLTRLHVHDNLRVNAERWTIAHHYHRQRQNIHYQSLWQPGIVYGLGVKRIAPPSTAGQQFQDQHWIEVQPGLAIDSEGNPIVVSPVDDRSYHLVINSSRNSPQTLYLVLRYVDPDSLEVSAETDRIPERFRFDQRVDRLEAQDIELCRIALSQTSGAVTMPSDPLTPEIHHLDLRHRLQLKPKARQLLTVGLLEPLPAKTMAHLERLQAAVPLLQSEMDLQFAAQSICDEPDSLTAIQIVYTTAAQLSRCLQNSRDLCTTLADYLKNGGSLIVETSSADRDLQIALTAIKPNLSLELSTPLNHSVWQVPFLFTTPPAIGGKTVDYLWDDGIGVLVGSVSSAWGGERLPRHEIRSWHEWGVNLLHHCWRRHHLRSLLS